MIYILTNNMFQPNKTKNNVVVTAPSLVGKQIEVEITSYFVFFSHNLAECLFHGFRKLASFSKRRRRSQAVH